MTEPTPETGNQADPEPADGRPPPAPPAPPAETPTPEPPAPETVPAGAAPSGNGAAKPLPGREPPRRVRRWYREATTAPTAPAGFTVLLDGKAMRTPAKAALVLPTAAFAAAIAAEWSAQGEFLDANQLPLTRIANTTIDLVSADRTATQKTLTAWAETDLLCYRAEGPLGLVERQARAWQPLLDWVRSRYQAELITVAGLMPAAQPASALEALARAVAATDDWHLALLHEATAAAGSLVLGLALLDHRIDAETAFTLSVLDESWQIEQWGEDAEAAHRRAGLRADLAVIGRALALLDDAECTAARIPEGRLR